MMVFTLKFCLSHSASISVRQSQGSGKLISARSLKRIPRERPRFFHLAARLATADLTSRRSSSPTRKELTVIASSVDNLAVPFQLSLYTYGYHCHHQPVATLLHTECGQLDFQLTVTIRGVCMW